MARLEVESDVTVEDLTEREREAIKETARRVVEEGEQLQEALGLSDDYVETMEFYAHYLYRNGKYDEAGVLVEGIVALDETRYYPYLLAGDVAMQQQRWEEAIPLLGAALNFGPEEAMLEGKLGEALLRVGRTRDAVLHLQKAVELAEEPDDKYRRRSEVLLELVAEEAAEVQPEGAGP